MLMIKNIDKCSKHNIIMCIMLTFKGVCYYKIWLR